MNGMDQIIVALWFFPVVLFLIIPLAITCLWVVIYPIRALLTPVAGQARQRETAKATVSA